VNVYDIAERLPRACSTGSRRRGGRTTQVLTAPDLTLTDVHDAVTGIGYPVSRET
jgi:hypothetical protein